MAATNVAPASRRLSRGRLALERGGRDAHPTAAEAAALLCRVPFCSQAVFSRSFSPSPLPLPTTSAAPWCVSPRSICPRCQFGKTCGDGPRTRNHRPRNQSRVGACRSQSDRRAYGYRLGTDKGVIRARRPTETKFCSAKQLTPKTRHLEDMGATGQRRTRCAFTVGREYFPTSPLAAEAMYRSADIRWQLEKADVSTRPSSKERESYLREGMEEKYMKEVIKKFPGTKWADLAAFQLIDNKLCGDWQGSSKCPVKESEIYEKYANEHPQSPARSRGSVRRSVALVRTDGDLQDRRRTEEIRRGQRPRHRSRTEGSITILPSQLGDPRPAPALPHRSGSTHLRKCQSMRCIGRFHSWGKGYSFSCSWGWGC